MANLSDKFPGSKPVEWSDSDGHWIGWLLPPGLSPPSAVLLPSGGLAIRDVGVSLVDTAREDKTIFNIEKWRTEIAAILNIKPDAMTDKQTRRLARLIAKVALRIDIETDD